MELTEKYSENVKLFDAVLRVSESFDMIKKVLTVGSDELTLYCVDGFVKDAVMEKLMLSFVSLKALPSGARAFADGCAAYVEVDVSESPNFMINSVMSGASLLLGSTFGKSAVIIDSRTYPARETSEPIGDKVMRGARDGFVETLVFNTALIRRRIRNPMLTMRYISVGKSSATDVVLCFIEGRADAEYVAKLDGKLRAIDTDSLTLGHQSLAECLIRKRWYNPFPKIRYTERPDAAAAQLLEGSVLILCDNSPEAMILPTSFFDFLQETNDFYFPPLTGTFIRLIRHAILWLTLFLTPAWYLFVRNPDWIPDWFAFALPESPGKLPIIAQLILAEFIIDVLRMASLNTPDMLSNSLSVVGGLILGDFAVSIGWLIPEVILYMAFVAIANFTQRSYELGYALKFLRMLTLVLTAVFNLYGFIVGVLLTLVLLATNSSAVSSRSYLSPLIPLHPKALLSMFVRVKKHD